MAIAIGNKTVANATPGGNSQTLNHNHNAGADGVLLVGICIFNQNISSITYGGQAMTSRLNYRSSGLSQRWAFFELANPPTGVNQLAISYTNSIWNPTSVFVRSFTGAKVGGVTGNNDQSTSPHSRSITVEENSIIYLMGVSVNAQSFGYIINNSTRTNEFSHNTNKQVGGALSQTGMSAGSKSCVTLANSGTISNARIEIREAGSAPVQNNTGSFFEFL